MMLSATHTRFAIQWQPEVKKHRIILLSRFARVDKIWKKLPTYRI